MRIAYLDCFSGISGDMLLGALVDAGVPLDKLAAVAESLNVGARLEARKVMRGGLTGTKVDVLTSDASTPTHEHTHDHPHEHDHPHQHDPLHASIAAHDHPHEQDHEHAHTQEESQTHDHSHEHAHEHGEHHRSLSTILGIIAAASLSDAVKQNATRAFQLLGEAEAAIHSIPVERVHFHEVGAVDTIVDIVCAAAGAELLAVDRWIASPLNVGSGTVECAHGTLPVPAPATLALIGNAPVYSAGPAMERVTPTGAAILRMLNVEYGTMPPMRPTSSGYGAGGRDTPGQPNLLRLIVGDEISIDSATHAAEELGTEGGGGLNPRTKPTGSTAALAPEHRASGSSIESSHVSAPSTAPKEEQGLESGVENIAILETVIDDSTPQLLAYVSDLLLQSGAWDVYRIPVHMKKGRTGVQLTILSHPDRLATLREILFRETTTIGAHWRIESKVALHREFAHVQTQWGNVHIKIARNAEGTVTNASPEYEDCRRIAEQHSIPLKQVMLEAASLYTAKADVKELK